ncbi:epi-neemfruitin B 7-O-acetyltransferse L7AT-like [Rutidosis leptorrhynchoides]|uniref:epi-neemfruitin B 7-O-acetyltransferse L7AT-like n=1 Tax=Rutidosis leptorrhynchoides TaxID=125765 RepID=UPI003A9A50F2
MQLHQMQSFNLNHRYSTLSSNPPHSFLNDTKSENYTAKNVNLEIISRETIKPASPTPQHLRIFNLSLIDQILFDSYIPIIIFIPNSNNASITDIISKRSKHLKETLSKLLCQFYPFAGQVKDMLHIECNDKGVNYIEARIDQTLEEFLCHPDVEKKSELMPESPFVEESAIGNYVIGIQINIFNCGGIGLSMNMAHKIMDFHTCTIFMKAWAATAKGSPETISPSFEASKVFPNDPSQEDLLPIEPIRPSNFLSTKRFVFDPTALALLKKQAVGTTSPLPRGPSRMEATTAVIWKAVAKAASTVKKLDPRSPHVLVIPVNIRKRASPAFTENSIGNFAMPVKANCFPGSKPNLSTLMGKLRESILTINSDYVESLKGEKGHETVNKMLKELKPLTNTTKVVEHIACSCVLNSGIYDLDFGWGKPIWFCIHFQKRKNIVLLTDTPKGGGVEATVTLSRDEMEIVEGDNELLSYATVNPSPLRFLNN